MLQTQNRYALPCPGKRRAAPATITLVQDACADAGLCSATRNTDALLGTGAAVQVDLLALPRLSMGSLQA